jgi:hypothetical protein
MVVVKAAIHAENIARLGKNLRPAHFSTPNHT